MVSGNRNHCFLARSFICFHSFRLYCTNSTPKTIHKHLCTLYVFKCECRNAIPYSYVALYACISRWLCMCILMNTYVLYMIHIYTQHVCPYMNCLFNEFYTHTTKKKICLEKVLFIKSFMDRKVCKNLWTKKNK